MSDYSWEAFSVLCTSPCPQLLTTMTNQGFEMKVGIATFVRIFSGPELKLMLF